MSAKRATSETDSPPKRPKTDDGKPDDRKPDDGKPDDGKPDHATVAAAFMDICGEEQGDPTPDLTDDEQEWQRKLLAAQYVGIVEQEGRDDRCEWTPRADVFVRAAFAVLCERGYDGESAFGDENPAAWPELPPVAGIDVHDPELKTAMRKVILSLFSNNGWPDSGIEFADDVVLDA